MRLFVAAQLPEQLVWTLSDTSAQLRECVRGRFVQPSLFHVTLAFLGEVDQWRIAVAQEALARACAGFYPFDVVLGDFGSFGRRSKATLWHGFADAADLPEIAAAVRHELDLAGIDYDKKPFAPHITLMRSADLTTGHLPVPSSESGTVESVCLFKSDLSGRHPVYEPIAVETLRA